TRADIATGRVLLATMQPSKAETIGIWFPFPTSFSPITTNGGLRELVRKSVPQRAFSTSARRKIRDPELLKNQRPNPAEFETCHKPKSPIHQNNIFPLLAFFPG